MCIFLFDTEELREFLLSPETVTIEGAPHSYQGNLIRIWVETPDTKGGNAGKFRPYYVVRDDGSVAVKGFGVWEKEFSDALQAE